MFSVLFVIIFPEENSGSSRKSLGTTYLLMCTYVGITIETLRAITKYLLRTLPFCTQINPLPIYPYKDRSVYK